MLCSRKFKHKSQKIWWKRKLFGAKFWQVSYRARSSWADEGEAETSLRSSCTGAEPKITAKENAERRKKEQEEKKQKREEEKKRYEEKQSRLVTKSKTRELAAVYVEDTLNYRYENIINDLISGPVIPVTVWSGSKSLVQETIERPSKGIIECHACKKPILNSGEIQWFPCERRNCELFN